MKEFKKATYTNKMNDPVRTLGLSVIQQAFADGAEDWLRTGETIEFWCYASDLTKDQLNRAINYWFPEKT